MPMALAPVKMPDRLVGRGVKNAVPAQAGSQRFLITVHAGMTGLLPRRTRTSGGEGREGRLDGGETLQDRVDILH